MTVVNMNKVRLVGTGYAEMPQDGRRYRFHVAKYRHDDGSEWGQILSMEEIPDVGPYLWIPSYGLEESEAEYLFAEAQEERENPHSLDAEWWADHRHHQKQRLDLYDELREKRAELIKRNHRTLPGGRR